VSTFLILLANAAGFAFLVIYVNLRIKKEIRSDKILERVNEELGSILGDINSATERNITLVEDRIKKLGDLIHQADGRLKLLKKSDDAQNNPAVKAYQELGRKPPVQAELPINEAEESNLRDKVMRYHREGMDSKLIAARLHVPEGEVELIISLGTGP
jgi:septal ring factor EnvC (AmiA/AmiB activator)